jgi:hypothetical protein
MSNVYERLLVPKLEQAIADLEGEAGDAAAEDEYRRLNAFLRRTVVECREFADSAEDTLEAFLRDR